MRRAVLLLAVLTACAGGDSEIEAEGSTQPQTASQAASPTPEPEESPSREPEPEEEEAPYPWKGFPKAVPKSDVPSQMRSFVNTPRAVAVAPGVWAEDVPGASLLDVAHHGGWVGYCASIKAAERQLEHTSGYSCW